MWAALTSGDSGGLPGRLDGARASVLFVNHCSSMECHHQTIIAEECYCEVDEPLLNIASAADTSMNKYHGNHL
jgi:hypothetical protein